MKNRKVTGLSYSCTVDVSLGLIIISVKCKMGQVFVDMVIFVIKMKLNIYGTGRISFAIVNTLCLLPPNHTSDLFSDHRLF